MAHEKLMFWGSSFITFVVLSFITLLVTELWLPLGFGLVLFEHFGFVSFLMSLEAQGLYMLSVLLLVVITSIFLTWPLLCRRLLTFSVLAGLVMVTPTIFCLGFNYCPQDLGIGGFMGLLFFPAYIIAILVLHGLRKRWTSETWQQGAILGAVLYILLALPSLLLL